MFVLLDLDETLVDKSSAFRRWATHLVAVQRLGDEALAWLIDTDTAIKARGPFFAEVTRRWPVLGNPQALWDDYARTMPQLVDVFPGVREGLRDLREAGFRLVILTNGRRDNQEAKLRLTGLADLVDGWVISEVVGYRKPAAEIYIAALDVIGCQTPSTCWMVGDDPNLDIAPAQAIGLRTAWVSHARSWTESVDPPEISADLPAAALSSVLRSSDR